MNPSQLHIDFTKVLHTRENNPESEANLRANRFHFTGQCAVVLSLLQKGIRLTTRMAMVTYGIGHLQRRILDLKENGVAIRDEYPVGPDGKKSRFKEYFL